MVCVSPWWVPPPASTAPLEQSGASLQGPTKEWAWGGGSGIGMGRREVGMAWEEGELKGWLTREKTDAKVDDMML